MLQLPHARLAASASLFFLLHRLLEACDSSVIPADFRLSSALHDMKSKGRDARTEEAEQRAK